MVSNQKKTHGVPLTIHSDVPVREGYRFLGWGFDPDGPAVFMPGGTYAVNRDIALYAVWDSTLTLVFDGKEYAFASKSHFFERNGKTFVCMSELCELFNLKYTQNAGKDPNNPDIYGTFWVDGSDFPLKSRNVLFKYDAKRDGIPFFHPHFQLRKVYYRIDNALDMIGYEIVSDTGGGDRVITLEKSSQPEQGGDDYFVTVSRNFSLIIRDSASDTGNALSKFTSGQRIKIVLPKTTQKDSTGGSWIKVYYDGDKTGWVNELYVLPDKPIEFIPPDTVTCVYNGKTTTLDPRKGTKENGDFGWGRAGGGHYAGQPLKENGRYRVAVGLKILHPKFQDKWTCTWDDFNAFNKNITVVLKHDTTGEIKELKCVIPMYQLKAHTFNKYPTEGINAGSIANYNIESGYMQTGIRYPKASNPSEFSPENMDYSIIEFCTNSSTLAADINVKNYDLVKVISNHPDDS